MTKETQSSRFKRETSEYYAAAIWFPANRDPLNRSDGQVSSVMDILEKDILLDNGFNFENVLPNGRPDLNSLKMEDTYTCPTGEVPVGESCGTFQNSSFVNLRTNFDAL